jgi:hypothetical protein
MTSVEQDKKQQTVQILAAYEELKDGPDVSAHKLAEILDDTNFGPEIQLILARAFTHQPFPQNDGFDYWRRNGGLTPLRSRFQVKVERANKACLELVPIMATYEGKGDLQRQMWLIKGVGRVKPLPLTVACFHHGQLSCPAGQPLRSSIVEIGWDHPHPAHISKSIVVVVTARHPIRDVVNLTIIKPPEKAADIGSIFSNSI